MNTLTKGAAKLGSMIVGGGTRCKKISSGTVSLNPASIAAQTRGTVTFTLTGAAAGDIVTMLPPSALDAGLCFVGAFVSSADTVTVQLANITGGAVDGGALTWRYLWIDIT